MKLLLLAAALSAALTGCATAPKDFYANPAKAKDTSLCRTLMESADPTFQRDVADELIKRGVTAEQCQNKVNAENAAIMGIAAVATGIAVVAACQNGCAAPSAYTAPHVDYDCYGGGGNGPHFVRGPFRLSGPDIYHLDADGDGIACEPYGDFGS
jgi:hypothetical protein